MKPIIESVQNPKVKLVQRLRDSRFRRRAGQIVIDGLREIETARRAGVAIETIFCSSTALAADDSEPALRSFPADLMQEVSDRVFEKMTYGQRRSQAIAIAATPSLTLERMQLKAEPLILVLDRVEKPGNIGAVARTAATAGADALLLIDPLCEVFNPNAIRASLGTVFSLPIAVLSFEQLRNWLGDQSIRLIRACVDADASMWKANLKGGLAIALGSEAHGLGTQWERSDWPAVQIPMGPGADSLNLSVSAAVLCYESLRQRQII